MWYNFGANNPTTRGVILLPILQTLKQVNEPLLAFQFLEFFVGVVPFARFPILNHDLFLVVICFHTHSIT